MITRFADYQVAGYLAAGAGSDPAAPEDGSADWAKLLTQ